tara:strand:+ start:496 stop:1644 length:1149 start_codon:yes stop_codon:yes gene_type:complete
MKKNVLLLTDADTRTSSIEHHQIKWLTSDYSLDVVSPGVDINCKDEINYYHYHEGNFIYKNIRKILLILRLYKFYFMNRNLQSLLNKIKNNKYDLIIVHHLRLLPVVSFLSKGSKIIFYAHEYYLGYNQDLFIWRILIKDYWQWISNNYLNDSNIIITVNKSIADLYKKDFGGDVLYLHNLVPYKDLRPKTVNPEKIRIIHHGLAGISRKIELMIESMEFLDERFELDLVLVSYSYIGKLYIKKLKKLASQNNRINFPEPVPFDSIEKFGNQYDIGLFFMPPSNKNEELSLGHKFFQYIQSRLALAISPLPEMKNIVEKYNIGIVANNFKPESIAEKLNNLTSNDIYKLKLKSHEYANKYDIRYNEKLFISCVNNLLKNDGN